MSKWDVLIDKCPRLYKNGMTFECEYGWFDIINDLSLNIEKILEQQESFQTPEGEENQYPEMFAVQVKEKYGTLRFYMSCETDEIIDLISDAEALSSQTCERCGKAGKMRGIRWLEVKCDNCYKEKI